MKTKLIAVLTLSIFLLTCSFAMAAVSPAIFINGNDLAAESSAIVEDDTTLVPLRAVFEALGQEVEWDAEDKSITSGGIWLQVNNPVATVDGENVNLAVPAKIINNVTYVPLQFIAVSLNKDVAFDSEQNRIDITDEPVVDEEVDEEAVADEDVATDEDADVDEDAAAEEEADAEEVVEE